MCGSINFCKFDFFIFHFWHHHSNHYSQDIWLFWVADQHDNMGMTTHHTHPWKCGCSAQMTTPCCQKLRHQNGSIPCPDKNVLLSIPRRGVWCPVQIFSETTLSATGYIFVLQIKLYWLFTELLYVVPLLCTCMVINFFHATETCAMDNIFQCLFTMHVHSAFYLSCPQ